MENNKLNNKSNNPEVPKKTFNKEGLLKGISEVSDRLLINNNIDLKNKKYTSI